MTQLARDRTPSPGDPAAPLLAVRDLQVRFELRERTVYAVNGVTFDLGAGESLAIVGESGSGKSVTARSVIGVLEEPPAVVDGSVMFDGRELLDLPEKRRRRYRGREIAMIFQDPLSSLNPVYTVGWQIGEMHRVHTGASRGAARRAAIELLDRVGIPSAKYRVDDYPHQFSGGMRQRAMIAMALALKPRILFADEPTTALDVTIQAQILELLSDLRQDEGMALVLITHDLGVVSEVADRVAVMYGGRVVESGDIRPIYRNPAHPYTAALLRSIPRRDIKQDRLPTIPGTPPHLEQPPEGCVFRDRCEYAQDVCATVTPPLAPVKTGSLSACHFSDEILEGTPT